MKFLTVCLLFVSVVRVSGVSGVISGLANIQAPPSPISYHTLAHWQTGRLVTNKTSLISGEKIPALIKISHLGYLAI